MSAFGKKFLSAFVVIEHNEKAERETALQKPMSRPLFTAESSLPTEAGSKFTEHFNKLFKEANLPGPDYYEFSKMTEAMHSIADEQTRYSAVFAGLQIQGLDKQKLLQSAQQYSRLLEEDAAAFHRTVSEALQEKVNNKKDEIEIAKNEIQKLSQQILNLQQQIAACTEEVADNERKIGISNSGYLTAWEACQQRLSADIEKINQYIL